MSENYFKKLSAIDFSDKTKAKNGLKYVSWTKSWEIIKEHFPDATFKVYENEQGRFWFDDGKTGWVKCSVTINGIEHIEYLSILDFKNKAISAETITSQEAAKAMQRAITKAGARHGVAIHVYNGEDLPSETVEIQELQRKCMDLLNKKAALSEEAKTKVEEVCKAELPEEDGNPKICEDLDKLESLKKKLLAIRK